MPPLSVNLPDKSTAILPDAGIVDFGHPTDVGTAQTQLARIRQRMAALNLTANAVGELAGHADCVRNLERAIKRGSTRGLSSEILAAVAVVLKCSTAWLTGEPGAPEPANAPAGLTRKLAERAEIERQRRDLERRARALDAQIDALEDDDKPVTAPQKKKAR